MYINQISPYTFYAKPLRKLVPINKFLERGGTILQLTPDDIEAIEKIKSEIRDLENEFDKENKKLAKTRRTMEQNKYLNKIYDIEYKIEQKRDEIEEIKRNRHIIQELAAKRKNKKS